MPTVSQSTLNFIKSWEGFISKKFPDPPGTNSYSIGYGYLLGRSDTGDSIDGINLWTGTISESQGARLIQRELLEGKPGQGTPVDKFIQRSITASLNQNQYDALSGLIYNAGAGSSYVKSIINNINKYASNLYSDDARKDILGSWIGPITTTTNQGRIVLKELVARRAAERDLFYGVYKGNPDIYRNQARNNTTTPLGPSTTTFINGSGENSNGDENLNFDFTQIQNNIQNIELDNVDRIWGSRNNLLEQTDWIGLKQYILYLCSVYYPQGMVPFVELIPYYTLDNSVTNTNSNDIPRDLNGQPLGPSGITYEQQNNQGFITSSQLIDPDRFANTQKKVNDLATSGGTDLFTLDPWGETMNRMYESTTNEQLLRSKRGFGFKIFGNISLTPDIQDGFLSKGGAIGIESVEIESGSELTNNATLITVKIKDVQGNKFFDLNSPWSLILNGGSTSGGDFYFRFGWQLRIPDWYENIKTGQEDLNARKFWTHPGWILFGGTTTDLSKNKTRDYIASIGKMCDNTITITQSTQEDSFKTPGYLLDRTQDTFTLDRKLNPLLYMSLSMLVPEIDVDSSDQSITASLKFMTQNALANLGCPVSAADYMRYTLSTYGEETITVTQLLQAYVKDNVNFWKKPNNNANIKTELQLNETNVEQYITIYSTNQTDENSSTNPAQILPRLDPNSIKIEIPSSLAKAYNSTSGSEDTRTSYEMMKDILSYNGIEAMGQTDQTTNNGLSNLVFVYSPTKSKSKTAVDNTEVKLVSQDVNENLSKEGYPRLAAFDDVFSFRFKGSLVEELKIEKTDSETQMTFQAGQQLADTFSNEVKKQDADKENKTDEQVKAFEAEQLKKFQRSTSNNITLAQRKTILQVFASSISGLTVKCLCHPWLSIGRLVAAKGTGFFDGFYMTTKIKHFLSDNNKFTTEVNAFRILNNQDPQLKLKQQEKARQTAMRNPGAGLSSAVSGSKETEIPVPIFVSGIGVIPLTVNSESRSYGKTLVNSKDPFATKFYITCNNKYEKNLIERDASIDNFYTNLVTAYPSVSKSWSDAFVSVCLSVTDRFGSDETNVLNVKPCSGSILYNYYSQSNRLKLITGYDPKKGDLVIYKQGIYYHFEIIEKFDAASNKYTVISPGPQEGLITKIIRNFGQGFDNWQFHRFGVT